MSRLTIVAGVCMLAGCPPPLGELGEAVPVCIEICETLVSTCALASFPDLESCEAGCLYGAEQGADVESQRACVELAQCDLFAIVECEHDFG